MMVIIIFVIRVIKHCETMESHVRQLQISYLKKIYQSNFRVLIDLKDCFHQAESYSKKLQFEKWRAIRASVNGVGGVLALVTWVPCLRGWHANVGGVDGLDSVLAWVAC